MAETPRHVLARVGLRVLVGFGIYLVLGGLWLAAGLDEIYEKLLVDSAIALLPAVAHFPVDDPTLNPLLAHNQGYVLVLLASLFLVCGKAVRRTWWWGYPVLGILFLVTQVLGVALQFYLDFALRFESSNGLALLLPWEMEILRRTIQLLFLFGLQVVSFLAVVLTALWMAGRGLPGLFFSRPDGPGPDEPSRPPARVGNRSVARAVVIPLACVLTLLSVAAVAWWQRETDPRHIRAHVFMGDVFFQRERDADAEKQYRAAIRGGARDGRIWFNLAGTQYRQGRDREVARTIERGLRVVTDPEWRLRLEQFGPVREAD